MSTLIACAKKEWMAQRRTGKFFIVAGIFFLFGIMNVAVAKLTPMLLEAMSETLESSGMVITITDASVLDSWVQFFKNLPMAIIAFVLLESGIFTGEYRSGTLILSLTKGLARSKVLITKVITLIFLWTVGYFLCFAVTYFGSLLLWENTSVPELGLAVFYWWLFGIWIIGLICLFSTVFRANIGVLMGIGGVTFLCIMLSLIPKSEQFLPTGLTGATYLMYETADHSNLLTSAWITLGLIVVQFIVSIRLFNKKEI